MWTDNDIDVARKVDHEPSSLIWKTWEEDPTKIATVRAIVSFRVKLTSAEFFDWNMASALAQNQVCSLPILGNGGSALQALFRPLHISVVFSCPCPNILISGSHLLALLQRITMKRLSADQSSSRPLEENSTRS